MEGKPNPIRPALALLLIARFVSLGIFDLTYFN